MADQALDVVANENHGAIAQITVVSTITGITAANPAVVTAANDFRANDEVRIEGVSGMTEINGISVHTDLVAVTALLDDLLGAVMARFTRRLKTLIAAPKQIGIAVVWCLVIDHGGAWVCAS